MTKVQLPPQFQHHPECAAGVVTIDPAIEMIERGLLTIEGAKWMFPPKAWALLPQKPDLDKTEVLSEERGHENAKPVSHWYFTFIGKLFDRSRSDRTA